MTDLRHLSPSPELMVNACGVAVNRGTDNIGVIGLVTLAALMRTLAASWAAATPLALLAFLASLAWMSRSTILATTQEVMP